MEKSFGDGLLGSVISKIVNCVKLKEVSGIVREFINKRIINRQKELIWWSENSQFRTNRASGIHRFCPRQCIMCVYVCILS